MTAALRLSSIAALALVALAGNAAVQPPAPPPCPEGTTIVCAVKAGEMQSYWNACDARRDGALVMSPGECPAGIHESGP